MSWPLLSRRSVLRLPAALGLSGCVPHAPPPPLPPATALRAIDVHCHIFNARDIPIEPFIREVVLREYPLASIATEGMIVLAQAILRLGAVSALDEARELRGDPMLESIVPADERLPAKLDDKALVRDRTERALRRMMGPRAAVAEESVAGPPARVPPNLDRFLRDLIARTGEGVETESVQPARRRAGRAGALDPAAAGRAVASIGGEITGIALLASLLTLPRAELADRLRGLPRSDGGDVSFFTPAMVDYEYWLNAVGATTPLSQQVEVMSALAAKKGRSYAVHAYVSFCPWRQMVEPGQIETVRDAILNKGCIGVKLYPVMGFLPFGNAAAPDKPAYPERLRRLGPDWAERLDAALAELYDFCVLKDVPILAHCAPSQNTSTAAGQRAAPWAWEAVLSKPRWAGLRLNLGHFGGVWGLKTPNSDDGWTAAAARTVAAHPNVYADVADLASVDVKTAQQVRDERAVVDNLNRILDGNDPQRVVRTKLMYGTDWLLLARDEGIDGYYPNMKTKFPAALRLTAREADGFLGTNAARFLGLIPSPGGTGVPQTRQRLEAFYKQNGLDNALLANWDRG